MSKRNKCEGREGGREGGRDNLATNVPLLVAAASEYSKA